MCVIALLGKGRASGAWIHPPTCPRAAWTTLVPAFVRSLHLPATTHSPSLPLSTSGWRGGLWRSQRVEKAGGRSGVVGGAGGTAGQVRGRLCEEPRRQVEEEIRRRKAGVLLMK